LRSACKKGQISDLVKTQYGFHIIKVMDKERLTPKPFEEVKDSLRAPLLLSQADKQASDTSDQISAAIAGPTKPQLDDLANQYKLVVGETRAVGATDPLLELGQLHRCKGRHLPPGAGELSLPVSNRPRLRRSFPENRSCRRTKPLSMKSAIRLPPT